MSDEDHATSHPQGLFRLLLFSDSPPKSIRLSGYHPGKIDSLLLSLYELFTPISLLHTVLRIGPVCIIGGVKQAIPEIFAWVSALIFAVGMVSFPSKAETEPEIITGSGLDKINPLITCERISLFVRDPVEHGKTIGLTKNKIERAVKSRLVDAGIYTRNATHSLNVFVTTLGIDDLGVVFVMQLSFNQEKEMGYLWEFQDRSLIGPSVNVKWKIVKLGLADGDESDNIVQRIGEFTDLFADEYIRVNTEACRQ